MTYDKNCDISVRKYILINIYIKIGMGISFEYSHVRFFYFYSVLLLYYSDKILVWGGQSDAMGPI